MDKEFFGEASVPGESWGMFGILGVARGWMGRFGEGLVNVQGMLSRGTWKLGCLFHTCLAFLGNFGSLMWLGNA